MNLLTSGFGKIQAMIGALLLTASLDNTWIVLFELSSGLHGRILFRTCEFLRRYSSCSPFVVRGIQGEQRYPYVVLTK